MSSKSYPVDEIAEKTILGLLLTDPTPSNFTILGELKVDDFYANGGKNGIIFDAISTLYRNDEEVDLVSVQSYLNKVHKLELIGGIDYLISLGDYVTSLTAAKTYVSSIKKNAILRNYLIKIDEIRNEYDKNGAEDITNFLLNYQKDLNDIVLREENKDALEVKEVASEVFNEIEKSKGSNSKITGIPCGFSNIDHIISGLNPGNMIIIAGRPGLGKSTLALNMAYKVSKQKFGPVLYFSLEMEAKPLTVKLFAYESQINSRSIDSKMLSADDKLALGDAKTKIQEANFFIDEQRDNNMEMIAIKSKKLKERYGSIALVVIDHIGITAPEPGKFSSDQEQLAYKSRLCKKLAGDLHCPVICVCQINRKAEENDQKIPSMANIKGSGAFEQDADQILLMYREKYYENQGLKAKSFTKNKQENPSENQENPEIPNDKFIPDITQIIVSKNRNGEQGTTFLYFSPQFSRFEVPSDDTLQMLKQSSKI